MPPPTPVTPTAARAALPLRRALPALPLRRGLLALATVLPLLTARPADLPGQTLTIPEYRELLLSKETTLVRMERELAAENARLDRLVREKQAAGSPRGQRSQELSAEIVGVSLRIAELERRRRGARADQRALREALSDGYTRSIDANLDRLGGLRQGEPGYGELLAETGRYISARDSLALQIRLQESLGAFRDFPILPSDGPAEIREKAGFYRDYILDVQARIDALDREIGRIRDRHRVGRRMRELQEDLAFQGEDAPKRPTDEAGGDLRDDPALGADPGEPPRFARTPDQQIAELEEEKRPLELLRSQFRAKVRDYEQRARTIYNQRTPSAEEIP